jgi:hypothetical protein
MTSTPASYRITVSGIFIVKKDRFFGNGAITEKVPLHGRKRVRQDVVEAVEQPSIRLERPRESVVSFAIGETTWASLFT